MGRRGIFQMGFRPPVSQGRLCRQHLTVWTFHCMHHADCFGEFSLGASVRMSWSGPFTHPDQVAFASWIPAMRQMVRRLLFLLLVSQIVGVAVAAPPRRAPKKASQRLPELKTPEDKLRFLEMIRQSFPAIRSGRAARFTSEDLDEGLERYVARGTSTPFAPIVDDETFLRRVTLSPPEAARGAPRPGAFP